MFRFVGSLAMVSILIVNFASASVHAPTGHALHDTKFIPLRRSWYQLDSHPVHALFKRSTPPPPGSPEWQSQYPSVSRPPIPEETIPQAWLDSLQAVEQAGLIPNITIPAAVLNQNPQYGPGDNPAGPSICSSSWKCRQPDDEWDAPDGFLAIGFDDGPSDGSPILYPFLQQNNIRATHFMIGYNILTSYDMFHEAYAVLQDDIAVHTWTHPYMTTQSNVQVVAQLGWTMQIISDSTGGRVPAYWRPPYGDSDNRVRAIAKEVFGLTQINWNQDSEDWRMSESNSTTLQQVETSILGWYAGPKTPGLVILEHELTPATVQAFIDTFPGIANNSWQTSSTVELFGLTYQNVANGSTVVDSMPIGVADLAVSSTSVNNQINTAPTTSTASSSTSHTTTQGAGVTSSSPAPTGSKNAASKTIEAASRTLAISIYISSMVILLTVF